MLLLAQREQALKPRLPTPDALGVIPSRGSSQGLAGIKARDTGLPKEAGPGEFGGKSVAESTMDDGSATYPERVPSTSVEGGAPIC